jgi:methylglutaconyl-CoA hydratase
MLQVESKGGVARVMLDRPEIRNAFDDTLIAAVTQALRALDADDGVRVVVLGGNGPAFCAGGDLNWMKRMSGYTYELCAITHLFARQF